MSHASWMLLGAFVLTQLGCRRVPGPTYLRGIERAEAAGVRCVVPIDSGDLRVEVTESSRRLCVSRARLIEPEVPALSDDALRAGPPTQPPMSSDEHVYCRLKPRAAQGGSLKFRCMRTNAENQLYDEDGELIPEAARFDDDDQLLDGDGRTILKNSGKPRKGDELRVKYFLGAEPAARYREMFTETVVSRLFWALGVPVDRVKMPASVRCFGCTPNPFGQMVPTQSSTAAVFTLASVERRYEGKKISVERKHGFLGLGSAYDHGWGFWEIERLVPTWSRSRQVEAEVLAMTLHLVGYNNLHSYQNELVCRAGEWDKTTGECRHVVAYVIDVGGTLGGPQAFQVVGDEEPPEMRLYPRGDFVTFSQGGIFNENGSCTLRQPMAGVDRVSEDARRILDERIRDRIGREQLRIIFEKANIHRMEQRLNDLVAEQQRLAPGPELDRAVQLLWADELNKRFEQILTARCAG